MKYILAILVIILQPISAYAIDVVSANGFTCSSTSTLVKCEGTFPGVSGSFGGIGRETLTIVYGNGPNSYGYESFTGCLVKTSEGQVVATNRWGEKKSFQDTKSAQRFCMALR